MKNTAMREALDTAGYETAQSEFYVACTDALRRCSGNPVRAREDNALRDALTKYLVAVVRDMNEPRGGGQNARDAHCAGAPAARPIERGEGGRIHVAAQISSAPDPATERDGDKGHEHFDAHVVDAPPSRPHRDGAGHDNADTHKKGARPAREPSVPKRSLAAMEQANKVLHADFHIGSVGMKFGDIRIPSLERMIFTAGREKVLGRVAKAYVQRQAQLPSKDAKLREVIDDPTMGRMIAFAKHASLHGIEYLNDGALLEQMEAFDAE